MLSVVVACYVYILPEENRRLFACSTSSGELARNDERIVWGGALYRVETTRMESVKLQWIGCHAVTVTTPVQIRVSTFIYIKIYAGKGIAMDSPHRPTATRRFPSRYRLVVRMPLSGLRKSKSILTLVID